MSADDYLTTEAEDAPVPQTPEEWDAAVHNIAKTLCDDSGANAVLVLLIQPPWLRGGTIGGFQGTGELSREKAIDYLAETVERLRQSTAYEPREGRTVACDCPRCRAAAKAGLS